jgi:hypothetical protein
MLPLLPPEPVKLVVTTFLGSSDLSIPALEAAP